MTTAFYSRPITTNYCHYQFQINASHSEKVPLGGPKILLTYNSTWTSTIITHNSTQLPSKIAPITQLPKITNITHEYQFFSSNTTRYPENNPPCLGNNADCLTTTNYLYNTYFYLKFTIARHNTWWNDFVRRCKAVR